MKKKNSVQQFCDELQEELSSFQEEIISRNYSNRSQQEWFKMLGDFLKLSSSSYFDNNDDDDGYIMPKYLEEKEEKEEKKNFFKF